MQILERNINEDKIVLLTMQFSEDISLQPHNTFKLEVSAKYFTTISAIDQLESAFAFIADKKMKHLVLGGGSNVLLTDNFDGAVLLNGLTGIELLAATPTHYRVKAMSGEVWHNFVMHCLNEQIAGLENLSLIPGTVGAAPIQNIGAYGVEVADFIESVAYYNIAANEFQTLSKEECLFNYRDSIFKNALKNSVFVVSVTFSLPKSYDLKLQYGAIGSELRKAGVAQPVAADVSQAVCNIRRSKLPDPKIIGNAGSFFKNPIVSAEKASLLVAKYPDISTFKDTDGVKIAAGWLIEKLGYKGKCIGNVKIHENQALVLTNLGQASGQEIYAVSQQIISEVRKTFDIDLEREVVVV